MLGFKKHNEVLSNFEKTSIAVVCSRWNEPFGRTSLEAASRGCAVIISNRGGLPETITNGIILNKLNYLELYKAIEELKGDYFLQYQDWQNLLLEIAINPNKYKQYQMVPK